MTPGLVKKPPRRERNTGLWRLQNTPGGIGNLCASLLPATLCYLGTPRRHADSQAGFEKHLRTEAGRLREKGEVSLLFNRPLPPPHNQLHWNPFFKGHFFLENFCKRPNPYSEARSKAPMSIKHGFTSYQHSSTDITTCCTSSNAAQGFCLASKKRGSSPPGLLQELTGPLTIAQSRTRHTSASTAGWTHNRGERSQCKTTQGGKPKPLHTRMNHADTPEHTLCEAVHVTVKDRRGAGGLATRKENEDAPPTPGLERTQVLIWATSDVGVCATPSTGTMCVLCLNRKRILFFFFFKTNQFCLSTGPGRPSDFPSCDTTELRTARGSFFLQSIQVGTRRARIS